MAEEPKPVPQKKGKSTYTLEELKQIEEELLRKLTDCRGEYQAAKKRYKELIECSKDLGLVHPDGRLSLDAALKVQKSSLARYSEAVRIFNEFILHHTLPEHEKTPDGRD